MSDEKGEKKKRTKKKKADKQTDAVVMPTADTVSEPVCDVCEQPETTAEDTETTPQSAPITEEPIVFKKPEIVCCCMCGASVLRRKAIMIGNQYVCSQDCMKKYALQRPRYQGKEK